MSDIKLFESKQIRPIGMKKNSSGTSQSLML
jgi:hypothetical protein